MSEESGWSDPTQVGSTVAGLLLAAIPLVDVIASGGTDWGRARWIGYAVLVMGSVALMHPQAGRAIAEAALEAIPWGDK